MYLNVCTTHQRRSYAIFMQSSEVCKQVLHRPWIHRRMESVYRHDEMSMQSHTHTTLKTHTHTHTHTHTRHSKHTHTHTHTHTCLFHTCTVACFHFHLIIISSSSSLTSSSSSCASGGISPHVRATKASRECDETITRLDITFGGSYREPFSKVGSGGGSCLRPVCSASVIMRDCHLSPTQPSYLYPSPYVTSRATSSGARG